MKDDNPCGGKNCGCGGGEAHEGQLTRRAFIAVAGAAAAGAVLTKFPLKAFAGPFSSGDFSNLVPAGKKLSPDWVRSLFERGKPTVYTGEALRRIGMPVGGICAGQVYLAGDGRLWHWDIFNTRRGLPFTDWKGEHYASPMDAPSVKASEKFDAGFALRVRGKGGGRAVFLDGRDFKSVAFKGQYPVGSVDFRDPTLPVKVSLEAFPPFIPLDEERSGLPCTIMRYTIRNSGAAPATVDIAGYMNNVSCRVAQSAVPGLSTARLTASGKDRFLECGAAGLPAQKTAGARPDIPFADFEKPSYKGWEAEGAAFGQKPAVADELPGFATLPGMQGKRAASSLNYRQSVTVEGGQAFTGTLTSGPFTIERKYINLLICGGEHEGRTCINLLVDGRAVQSITGSNSSRMAARFFDVSALQGKTAQLQIVDKEKGPWGFIAVDDIVFGDTPRLEPGELRDLADYGSLCLALTGGGRASTACADMPRPEKAADVFKALRPFKPGAFSKNFSAGQHWCALGRSLTIAPGKTATVTFAITWHFPNLHRRDTEIEKLQGIEFLRAWYQNKFHSAGHVADYVAANIKAITGETLLWRDTWQDSTLPHWFLERTFIPTDALATATCMRFSNGRFYAMEGTYCCAGTCTHVWQYAQATARIFPELERGLRERVDFGLAMKPTGEIGHRAEFNETEATDGQAGTIVRAYREHLMSPNDNFLRRNWPRIKRAMEFLINKDGNSDGIIECGQHNTLDSSWYGPVAWISGLYLAALASCEQMASETGDHAFAARCRKIRLSGEKRLVSDLYNGEYFINKPDPAFPEAINSNIGCHIDQVMGQSFAWQVGLGRILPEKETLSALKSLWKYNYTPDIGPYRKNFEKIVPGGRWYAMPGEGGLLMCTFPRGGGDRAGGDITRTAKGGAAIFIGYFNECMTGFEYQAASHMMWEGMAKEALAITRTVHDRYSAHKRNPWNEVECSDHYGRALAAYGVFLAACGFEHHGPRGHIGFAPRLTPKKFKCAFTSASGWGSFSQKIAGGALSASIAVKWGSLRLKTVSLSLKGNKSAAHAKSVICNGHAADFKQEGSRVLITLPHETVLNAGETLNTKIVL